MPQTNPAKFLSEVKSELTKVTWPTRDEVIRLTLVVVIISLAVGLFVGGLDFIFTKAIQLFLSR
jgi:preprotein translocase subunit SecE